LNSFSIKASSDFQSFVIFDHFIKISIENHPKSVSSLDNAKDKTMGSSDASAIYAGDASPLYAFTRDNEYENESSSFRCWHLLGYVILSTVHVHGVP